MILNQLSEQPGGPAVRYYHCSPSLRDFVTSYYVAETDTPISDHLHPEWCNIRFSVTGRWTTSIVGGPPDVVHPVNLYGPSDRARAFSIDSGLTIGIGLSPLGWLRFIGINASACANRNQPLGDVLGMEDGAILAMLRSIDDERERMLALDRLLESRLGRPPAEEPAVRAIHATLMKDPCISVCALAQTTGMSERTLLRICERVFGFSTKRLLRRQRFLRTLEKVTLDIKHPSGIALDEGYYDQAHFNRDFRAHMGTTPTAYFAAPRMMVRQVEAERAVALGVAMQGLHPAAALSKV